MEPKFYNKNGELSRYGFACGYVEKREKGNMKKEMYMEHSHFHVRMGKNGEPTFLWQVFSNDELTKARKFYHSIKI